MSRGRIYLDFETASHADLGQVGAWEYSLHPTTRIICMCYRIRRPGEETSSEPVRSWVPAPVLPSIPIDLYTAICAGYEVEAHNYSFELAIWTNICVPRMSWPAIKAEQWRDTMATGCYYALPAKLEQVCRAIGIDGKDPEGARLITKYSKLYLKTAKEDIPPEDMEKWIKYCSLDVIREEQVSDYLGDLPARELPVFLLDQEINLRGMLIDHQSIADAIAIVDQRAADLTAQFRALTGVNPTQRDKIMAWTEAHGVKLESMTADYLEELLEGDMPSGPVRSALTLRLKVNKASTKKLDAMARQSGSDGRARWQQRYHGAQTGRQTGSGFQPLNLVRGWEDVPPEQLVRDLTYRNPQWLDVVYGDAMDAVARASRHHIKAAPGHKIYAGDFVSVEAVVLACLSGETWKIEAFRNKEPIYERMGDKIHGLPPGTVTKKTHPLERQDGKTGELAFGYQGALNAWLNFDSSGRHSDERIIEICRTWRAEHPATVAFWGLLERAAIKAVQNPGETFYAREIGFQMVDEWLSMILPDGKRIWYREPVVQVKMPAWHQPATKPACFDGTCNCTPRPMLTYMAQKEGQWKRVATYGGKLAENACQAVSRQLLIPSMLNAKAHGFHIILSVYDEVVCEDPDGFSTQEDFEHILAAAPGRPWAADWPIRVDAWIGDRYKK